MTRTSSLLAAGLAFGLAAALALTSATNSIPAAIEGLQNPGRWVPWAIIAMTYVARAAVTIVIGFLLLAVVLVPSGPRLEGLAVRAVRIAANAAIVWAAAVPVVIVLSVSDLFARPPGELNFAFLWSFVSDFAPGRALLIHAVAAIVIAVVLRWTFSQTVLVSMLLLALASIVPLGLTGHAAGSGSHALATVVLVLHVSSVTLWVGGLVALTWLGVRGSRRLRESVERFSPIAFITSLTVIGSGVVGAVVNLAGWDGLATGYGAIVALKVVLSAMLIILGAGQRQAYLRGRGSFLRLAVVEWFVMVAAIGAGVALARTPRPVGEAVVVTPAERLIGGPLPPEPSFGRLFTEFIGNGFGLTVVIFGLALYLWGVAVLKRRGDRWPIGRTVSWLVGLGIFGWGTFGGLGVYSPVMFSMHMIAHMMLAMVATIFLVLAAPLTLALRTLPGPRRPGEVSPRGLLNAFLHSRYSRLITHPAVAAAIFMGSLYVVYLTDIFELLMRTHIGHSFMEFHFLLSGFLYFYVIIGVDPSPRRLPPLARLGVLMVSLPFHAFFSVALMNMSYVAAEAYYVTIDRPYATDLLADQRTGAEIAWGMGEVPLLIVMFALFIQWLRHDRRETVRRDRAAARDGDAELTAYNAMLARMSHDDDTRANTQSPQKRT